MPSRSSRHTSSRSCGASVGLLRYPPKSYDFCYWAIVAAAVAILGMSGCSSSDQLDVVPVSGKVFYDGQPADGVTIYLHHKDPAIAKKIHPSGDVDANGNFKISTYGIDDGAPPGDYKATFEWTNSEDGPSLLPEPFSSPQLSNFNVKISDSKTVIPTFEFQKIPEPPPEKPNFMP